MPIRPIVTIGHPALRAATALLSKAQLASELMQTLIDDLIETMHHANGAGLAANQIGESFRLCAIHVQDNPRYPYKPRIPLTVLVNPQLEFLTEDRFAVYEGCLSVPRMRGEVTRVSHVRVRAWDRFGADVTMDVRGLSAGTFQHEVDHLDGLLFTDRLTSPSTLCSLESFETFVYPGFLKHVHAIVARYGS